MLLKHSLSFDFYATEALIKTLTCMLLKHSLSFGFYAPSVQKNILLPQCEFETVPSQQRNVFISQSVFEMAPIL